MVAAAAREGRQGARPPDAPQGREYLDAYLAVNGIVTERGSPLWRSLTRTRELGKRRMSRVDVFRMVKRRITAI